MTISIKKNASTIDLLYPWREQRISKSRYISVYRPFMSLSIIEHGAVDNRYMSIIGWLCYNA